MADVNDYVTGNEAEVARWLYNRARRGFLRQDNTDYSEPDPATIASAKNRFEVRTSPDGRIKMYFDKMTNKLLSRAEFNELLPIWKQDSIVRILQNKPNKFDYIVSPQDIEKAKSEASDAMDTALSMMPGAGPGVRAEKLLKAAAESAPVKNVVTKLAEKIPIFGASSRALSLPQRTAFTLFRERPEVYKKIIGAIKGGQPEEALRKLAADNQVFASELHSLKDAVAQDLLPKVAGAEVAAVKAAPQIAQASVLPGMPAALEEGAAAGKGLLSKVPYGAQVGNRAAFEADRLRQLAAQARGGISEGFQAAKQGLKSELATQTLPKAAIIANRAYQAGQAVAPQSAMTQPTSAQDLQGGMSEYGMTESGVSPADEFTGPPADMAAQPVPNQTPVAPNLVAKKSAPHIARTMPVGGAVKAASPAGPISTSMQVKVAEKGGAAVPTPTANPNVPMGAGGTPRYNYYSEMMNSADENNAYYRDFVNLREQARQAAVEAASRGERYQFVPLRDVKANRVYFVNANGDDIALDMNDQGDRERFNYLVKESGVDPIKMSEWMSRASRPLLRHMAPATSDYERSPDFNFNRQRAQESVDTQGNKLQYHSDVKRTPEVAPVSVAQPAVPASSPNQSSMTTGGVSPKQAGNIDVNKRPVVRNADGSISTLRSMSIGTPQGEVLIPTISPDGRVLSENEAIEQYKKSGQHLGVFNTPDEATRFAKQLSDRQATTYGATGGSAAKEMPTPTAQVPEAQPKQEGSMFDWANTPGISPDQAYKQAAAEAMAKRKAAGMTPAQQRRIDTSRKWM